VLPAPLPPDETARLAALRRLALLDTPPDARFDRITRRTAEAFDVPIVLVTLVDVDRQWFKSCVGLDVDSTGRDESFCGHAIHDDSIFEVTDAAADLRFLDNPLVTGSPHIRFYAGRPLRARGGERLGTLCLIDREPRTLTTEQRRLLDDLGAWAEAELQAVELQEAARLLAELEQVREQVVGTVSHELRTPLQSVQGALEALLAGEEGSLTEGQLTLGEVALRNSRRLERLADDLLVLSQLDAAGGAVPDVEVDLHALAGEVAEALVAARGQGRVECRARSSPRVRGDAERLRQTLVNLVDNALKYSPDGATVEVVVDEHGGWGSIDVVDHGVGIPAEELDRVGLPFYRASTGSRMEGTGLGLSICRRIAAAHGGRIDVRSRVGLGSTFSLVLPALRSS
jgi:signal transduction histidine kinase